MAGTGLKLVSTAHFQNLADIALREDCDYRASPDRFHGKLKFCANEEGPSSQRATGLSAHGDGDFFHLYAVVADRPLAERDCPCCGPHGSILMPHSIIQNCQILHFI